ncbi:hypothetical protein [Calothrix sp. PCC 6303]|uniref:hypothetical protein n=1 Tax=Calothrix sp. PCC 6303 TaxID=1170562 RepID=UPI0002A04D37|nr:hypothetical protein [Calothrix sp. PCC 6303]AFZ03050.1 hypothetical protein Cal6303_4136 [Calothrix sp. PCC 6303]
MNKYCLKPISFLIASCSLFSLFVLHTSPTFAHKVKIAVDIGATLHIEPNDSPRAGEVSKVWLAMTRKGGKLVPLSECNCQLNVYSQPYKTGDAPLLQPSLQPLNVDKYQNIPSADVKFPQAGAYYLELSGKPKSEGNFQPFKLKFDVTVAGGIAVPQPTSSLVTQAEKIPFNDSVSANKEETSLPWAIIIASVAGAASLGILLAVFNNIKRS